MLACAASTTVVQQQCRWSLLGPCTLCSDCDSHDTTRHDVVCLSNQSQSSMPGWTTFAAPVQLTAALCNCNQYCCVVGWLALLHSKFCVYTAVPCAHQLISILKSLSHLPALYGPEQQ
jgi:hypothetical protein